MTQIERAQDVVDGEGWAAAALDVEAATTAGLADNRMNRQYKFIGIENGGT